MLFNSLTFLAFFAVVLALHNLPLPWRAKKINLLIASYVFYGAWSPPFVLLLWFSTGLDWWAANRLDRTTHPTMRKVYLFASLVGNLGLLGYFKYGDFLMENFASLMRGFGLIYVPPEWNIILPVGISFYTFQTMAYTLDVYLGRARPTGSFLNFALFVTFFPQLVAGPIVRPTDLIPQFERPHVASRPQLLWGLMLMVVGLFQKIVLADGLLAPVADKVYSAGELLHPLDAWLGTLAFSGQIFFDFAGYTTTAIGCSLALGFSLIDNFRYPYAAIGFSDFWRRWHISLSTWLRDYLYVPLGGNRRGTARTYTNLMITMLLGGLWHGAAWTFVVWGGLHGLYLGVERACRSRWKDVPFWQSTAGKLMLALLTYLLVNITWVFFRSQNFATARRLLRSMLFLDTAGTAVLTTWLLISGAVTIVIMAAAHWRMRHRLFHDEVARMPVPAVGLLWGAMLFLIVITQGGGNAFIYFQF